jgi:hypothetical protein
VHGFNIDTDERRNVVFALAVLGVGAAYGLNRLLDVTEMTIPWWFDAPASFGFFGLFYWLFDQWVWRLPVWRTLRLISTPDLSGRWSGYITSSHDLGTDHKVTVDISQSWTGISVVLTGAGSRSYSTTAVLRAKAPGGPELTHTYRNEPLARAVGTMNIHHGTATMRLTDDHRSLEGDYYTGRGRETYGSIKLQRGP